MPEVKEVDSQKEGVVEVSNEKILEEKEEIIEKRSGF